VLTGVGNRSALRGALESLDTRQQILIMGHAVPMPIMMRTRPYDEEFYRAMDPQRVPHGGEMDLRDLFGDQ